MFNFNFKITKDFDPEEVSHTGGVQAESVLFSLLILLIFLAPIFFLPEGVATLLSAKMFLVHVVVLV